MYPAGSRALTLPALPSFAARGRCLRDQTCSHPRPPDTPTAQPTARSSCEARVADGRVRETGWGAGHLGLGQGVCRAGCLPVHHGYAILSTRRPLRMPQEPRWSRTARSSRTCAHALHGWLRGPLYWMTDASCMDARAHWTGRFFRGESATGWRRLSQETWLLLARFLRVPSQTAGHHLPWQLSTRYRDSANWKTLRP